MSATGRTDSSGDMTGLKFESRTRTRTQSRTRTRTRTRITAVLLFKKFRLANIRLTNVL